MSAAVLLWSTAMRADTGFGPAAGDVVVRLAAAGVVPLSAPSHIDGIGGRVGVTATPAPEVDIAYFLTKSWSIELIAASTRHELAATGTSLSKVLSSKIDLGSTYVLPPAVTVQYHLAPDGVIDPYLGVGIDVLFSYDVHENTWQVPGIGRVIRKVGLSNALGPVFDAGVDYHLTGSWFLNIDYKQILDRVDARIHTAVGLIKANVNLDPAVLSAGVSYKF